MNEQSSSGWKEMNTVQKILCIIASVIMGAIMLGFIYAFIMTGGNTF